MCLAKSWYRSLVYLIILQSLGTSLDCPSMASVQLRDAISDSFAVVLDPDCFNMYPTPAELKVYVEGDQGVPTW